MRPVNKGGWPTHGVKSVKYVFKAWSNAGPHLKERTGLYCHLCELPLSSGSSVEHIKYKDKFTRLSNSWTNFLLACVFCNSRKGAAPVVAPYRRNYYWPHISNTLMTYSVSTEQLIEVGCNLDPDQQVRAGRLIEIYKLAAKTTDGGAMDQRHLFRTRAFTFAVRRLEEYVKAECTVQAILDNAVSSGFFSLWYQVFIDHNVVRLALINEPSFCLDLNWFDADGRPLGRHAVDPNEF